MCHRSVLEEFTAQCRRWVKEQYPDPYAEGAMVWIAQIPPKHPLNTPKLSQSPPTPPNTL